MANAYTRSELTGQPLVWVVSVTFAGRVWRFASKAVETNDADGDPIFFDGGLSPLEVDFAIGTLSGEADFRSLPLDLYFPVNVAAYVEDGHTLDGAQVEVAYLLEGKDWPDRRVVLLGQASQPVYGDELEPVSMSVEGNPYDDAGAFPPDSRKVDDVTFSTETFTLSDGIVAADEGAVQSFVFGSAGHYDKVDGSGVNTTSGAPAPAILTDTGNVEGLLINMGDVDASQVYVFNDTGAAYPAYVHSGSNVPSTTAISGVVRDALGQPFSYAVLLGNNPDGDNWTTDADLLAFRDADNAPFWVGYSREASFGLAAKIDGKAIDGAGDLLLYMLAQSTLTVDQGRWEAARAYLNRYRVAGYIDEVVTPWDWISDNLLPILPMSIQAGPQGIYPVLWRLDATASDARWDFTAGPGFERSSMVEYTRSTYERVSAVTVNFARRAAKSGVYRRSVTVTFDRDDSASQSENLTARNAAARGGLGALELETDVVYDEATAWQIAHDQIRYYGVSPRRVTYTADNEYSEAMPGDAVTLTDSEIALSSRVAILENKRFNDDAMTVDLTFVIFDEPARDLRRA